MNDSKRAKLYLVLGLVFVILFSHLPVIYTLLYHELTGAPTAVDGIMDAETVSPARKIVLDGKWEFYWKQFIATNGPRDVKPDLMIDVPGYWSKYKTDGEWLPAEGYGSFRLILQGLEYKNPVTVLIPDFGSAYRVFIDGVLTSESGNLSVNSEEIHTVPKPILYPVTLSDPGPHEIIVEVATTRFSGLCIAPVLKDYDRAVMEDIYRNGLRFILFGTVMFSFFILTVTYMLSFRRNKQSIWLPALSLLIILRIMLTTEFYSFWQHNIFFGLSYEAANELMFFVTFALNFMLIFLAQEQFGVDFYRREKWSFLIYYVFIYLVYLLTPRDFYNQYLTVLLPVSVFALEFHSFFKIYFGTRYMEKHGIIAYWGIILAISGLIIDCYYINGNIYPNMSLALLIMLSICLMTLSIISALRIAGIYRDLAVSSSRLEQARRQISIQREYYDALTGQMNEIRALRHDMRHFIGVMRRLIEKGQYEELKKFLGEYNEKVETDQIPLYCENVVVNSVLGYYSIKASDIGIPFDCACSIPRQISVSEIDICIVLGNALENAIEACSVMECSEMRFIAIKARITDNNLLIKIENSYNGHIRVYDGNYRSTKDEEIRGIGIKNIKKVMEVNKGYLKIDHSDKVFALMAAFPVSTAAPEEEHGYR